MKLKIFSMFDRVARIFGEPFVAVSNDIAIRRFNYIMSQSPMVSADMQLFCLGEFDVDNGNIVSDVQFVCDYVKE